MEGWTDHNFLSMRVYKFSTCGLKCASKLVIVSKLRICRLERVLTVPVC